VSRSALPSLGLAVLGLAACRAPRAAELRARDFGPARAEGGLALRCAKLLTLDGQDRVFDPGMVLVAEGKITYVGAPIEVPDGYEFVDRPDTWAWPGLVDLHSHIQSTGWWDTNDMVKPLNPEFRVRAALDPGEERLRQADEAGVTTLFGIPGSGTSLSGFGVLYKTKQDATYEQMVLRDPGGMKVAFNYNPQRGGGDLGSTWCGLAWGLEELNDRVAARVHRPPAGPPDPATENLERVHRGELPVLIHCASAEGVAGSVRMWKDRYHTQCVVSHGDWDGHFAAGHMAERGVPLNHGPRLMNFTTLRREEKILGTAQAFLDAGVPDLSLNTDAPVVPQDEFFLQGTMSARLGSDPYQMLQAMTIHPARSFLIGDRVGSLEVGKDADVVLSNGDPLDPRSRIELVLVDGEIQYSRPRKGGAF
jgi:imidazolonepropionase-like amidohydrolase